MNTTTGPLPYLLFFILLLPVLAVWISTLVWVYRDAERCGKPGILVALLVGLLVWPVGLLVWLILRQDYLAQALPPLAVPPLLPPGNCPQCGRALASSSTQGLCPACLLRQVAFESVAPGSGLAGFTPPAAAELAELFPQFESLELLGRGGMGAVYKARQTSLDRFVALKILPAEANEDPAFGERFQREARALAQLSHPNIVGVHDFGQAGAYAYLVMEFVDGANLRQLQRGGHLSPSEALAIVPQICEALQFAHDHGIVHRDIKPENILIDTQGRVKIADFGLAKMMRLEAGAPDLTLTRHAIGTPQYMAPEQIEKPETVDHRADIYSLGVVFYEMLTGELPIGRFSSPSQRVEVDVRLDEVVLKALEKEPALRYQQASAFKTEVETVAGGTAPLPAPSPAAPPFAAPPFAASPAMLGLASGPVAPPAKQKKSGCWILLAVLLVVPILLASAMAGIFFLTTPTRITVPAVPWELQLEMQNPSGARASTKLNPMQSDWTAMRESDDHHQFVSSIGINTEQQYWVDGTIKPFAYDDQYVVDLTVKRRHAGEFSADIGGQVDSKTDSIIFREIIRISEPRASLQVQMGNLDGNEFFLTLMRAEDHATSGTKTPVQDWWFWPVLVMLPGALGLCWMQERPGPHFAGLGTGFMGASVLLFAGFLAQVMHVFDRNAQNVMALDAEGLASGIETAQATALLGVMVFLAGAVSAGLALFKYRYRALWFHRVLVDAGILMLFLVPIGTVLGVLLLVYVGNRRGEFGAEQMGTTTPLGNGAASPTPAMAPAYQQPATHAGIADPAPLAGGTVPPARPSDTGTGHGSVRLSQSTRIFLDVVAVILVLSACAIGFLRPQYAGIDDTGPFLLIAACFIIAATLAFHGRWNKKGVYVAADWETKLCPTAIWGAVQAAICLALIPACYQLQGDERTNAILALVAVGCSTAICGAIAISQIRRSEGKLYGMGLAVFDLVVPVAIAAASVVFLF
jgi:serine/threonine protein kinase